MQPVSTVPPVRNISPSEAEQLIRDKEVRVLDVRTPEEYTRLGHIPDAVLMPVDLITVAPATLPKEGKPWLVYCEHGVRSVHAARLLSLAGFGGVMNMTGGMSCWTGARNHAPGSLSVPYGPASWLIENAAVLPQEGRVLDVACGRGRHSLLLAAAGLDVTGVDNNEIEKLREDTERIGLTLKAEVTDLEADHIDLGSDSYDVVLGIHYLHRPLFPALIRALKPGGVIIYETFTVDQAELGHPKNPLFLLEHGELPKLVAPLEIIAEREGEFDGRRVSGVVARKPERIS